MVEKTREIVVPGEIIGDSSMLPGEGTLKRGENIIAIRYGLKDSSEQLVKVIPLSGIYDPRRGNLVIGKVVMLTNGGWVVDIDSAETAFLPLSEVPRYVNKDALAEVADLDDLIIAKIDKLTKMGVDLTIKPKGLGRIDEGIIMGINPNKVPRVIGKEGSMISLIKEKTNCQIQVGQNGYVWIQGEKIDDEIVAKRAIEFVCEKSFISGLTEELNKWFEGNLK